RTSGRPGQRRQRLALGYGVAALAQLSRLSKEDAMHVVLEFGRFNIADVRVDQYQSGDLRQVSVYKRASVVAAERVSDQDIGPRDAGIVKRAVQLVGDAHARARHRPRVAETRASTIERARARPLRNPGLHDCPRWCPIFPAGIEDDSWRAASHAVQVQSMRIHRNEVS